MKDYFKKIFSYKTTWALLVISLFSIGLSLCRKLITGQVFYMFLLWNLFLAFVPWFAASIVYIKNITNKFLLIIIIIFWLIFFPNAPYILTDLIHLGKGNLMPVWYDLILLLSFGFAGMIYGFVSLQMIEEKIRLVFKIKHASVISFFLIYVSCFGIYLGRFLRWNSWDIVKNIDSVFDDIFQRIIYPGDHRTTWGFTFLFGTLLNILYIVFKQEELKIKQTQK